MAPILHSASVVASDFLVASIWQGLIVAGCVALVLRLLPGLTAAVRSTIWTAVLLLVLFFPALSLALHSSRSSAVQGPELLHASDTWSLVLLSIWTVFSLVRAGQLIGSGIRLQRLARRAVVVDTGASVAALLGSSKRRVQLCSSVEAGQPSVAGFFRPRILLSPDLLARLSTAELEQVVLHEMEHLRRYDDWTNLLQKLSLALFPLHPVLVWLDQQMCRERELACDDRVLRQTRARKAYAACLARVAEDSILRRGFSLALGALGNRKRAADLTSRVHRILRAPEKGMSPAKAWIATAALLGAVFTGSAWLARSPQLIAFTASGSSVSAAGGASGARSGARFRATSFPTTSFRTTNFRAMNAYQRPAARPMLLKAVIPQRRQVSMLPAVARKRVRRPRMARSVARRSLYAQGPYFTLAAWRPTIPAARFAVEVTEVPQFLYAAVPMRDGWLIVQL